ncbi:MAG: sialate O-acetylesterase [Mariniphaga sp.]|nr:sialate O-acetylesterase [Mariniphaga sp.]
MIINSRYIFTGILFNLNIACFGQLKLPKLVSDGMVLQRNTEVKIWGWATSDETVQVHFLGENYTATTSNNGEWEVKLSGLEAGGPHVMQIISKKTIKGVIWYQGESNAERPGEKAELFPSMIQNWREKWNQGDFPFLFVQLHNYMESYDYPTESNWARTREAQKEALKINRKKAVLTFSNVGSGLVVQGSQKPKQFAVAGKDKKFVWAKAKIKGNKIIVWNSEVKKPVAVRYAWADNPEDANLFNKEGLPATPFRTDNW